MFVKKLFQTICRVVKRFREDECMLLASGLTYTTLLSLVPLMTVSLSLLSAFPVFKTLQAKLQTFIFSNLMVTSGKVVQDSLLDFAERVKHLPILGMVFLLVTAVLLLFTIEKTLNRIWQIKQRRPLISGFLLYWGILTLAPLLMGASLALSSYLYSLPYFHVAHIEWLWHLAPWALIALAYAILFIGLPNRNVPILNGLIAGGIAATLFEISKKIFALYLHYFPTYEVVYGALAAIPLFLIWIYLCWLITLLGAEISYILTVKNR